MDSGFYAAMTGLVSRSQALDTAASNLANAQTPGYRAEREYFRSVLLGSGAEDSQLGETVNNYGLLGGDRVSLAQGPMRETGNPLDLGIEGQGFFAVQAKNGIRYTRDGSFHLTEKGTLVSQAGEPVLSAEGKPMTVPPGAISIGADGTISVAGGAAGKIGVFTFPDGTQLTPEGSNRYISPASVKPALSASATVEQGKLEGANEDVVQGTVDLIMMQRQFEMMQKALTIFHTEFNEFATEDLPKV